MNNVFSNSQVLPKRGQSRGASARRVKHLNQLGATLIEAMVSVLVFSVGALGLGALQLTAITASGDSQQRSIAIWKAQELADRIRSNPGLLNTYITQIASTNISKVGVDDPSTVISCGAAQYVTPALLCADNKDGPAAACTDNDKVVFDVWEIFCDPNSGAAIAGELSADGSAALVGLDLVLRQNVVGVDGNDDVELHFEWLSREGDANAQIATDGVINNVKTDLCGRSDVDVNSRLDVYCLRFRP